MCSYFAHWFFVFLKQKTAYDMRISDWSSDVCSSDLADRQRVMAGGREPVVAPAQEILEITRQAIIVVAQIDGPALPERFIDEGAKIEMGVVAGERKSVVLGKSVAVRVDLGGARSIKKKINIDIKMSRES